MKDFSFYLFIFLILCCVMWSCLNSTIMIEGLSLNNSDDTAKYSLKFITPWGAKDTANFINYPPNPHTGNMFLVSHDNQFKLFEVGKLASKGVSTTAMYGTLDELINIASSFQNKPHIDNIVTSPVLNVPGERDLTIDVDSSNGKSLISFITMIAPSSDWFTGFSIDLKQSGTWLNTIMIPLFVFVAGTDSNQGFVTDNKEHKLRTQPNVISLKNDKQLYPDEDLKPIAMMMIQRIS